MNSFCAILRLSHQDLSIFGNRWNHQLAHLPWSSSAIFLSAILGLGHYAWQTTVEAHRLYRLHHLKKPLFRRTSISDASRHLPASGEDSPGKWINQTASENTLGKFSADSCDIKSVIHRIPLLTHLKPKGPAFIVQKQLRWILSFPLGAARN